MTPHYRSTKRNIPMYVATVLFCLTLISVCLTSGLYAKYLKSALNNETARVIKFGDLTLTETGDFNSDGKLVIIPGVDLQKKAVLNFAGSEAATCVFVEVTANGWTTTDHLTFSNKSSDKTLMNYSIASGWTYLSSDGNAHVYYRLLSPNTAMNDVDIIAGGKVNVSDAITKSEIQSMTGISIELWAAVVQSDGYKTAAEAWNSIASKKGS